MALYDDKLYRCAEQRRTWSRSTPAPARSPGTWRCPTAAAAQRAARRERASSSRAWAAAQAYVEQKCFISAYDAATGKQLWRFDTVAKEGEPGGDTWGGLPNLFRAGGETWITGSYDPDLNLTYWGTAQAKPWMPVSRGMRTGDKALYTSSTVALDADTGKLAWHYSARARRSARPRRRVRARARRCRRPEPGVHRRQGRRAVEARSEDRQVPRPQGDGVPERLGELRPPDRASRATARTSSTHEVGQWIDGCPSTEGGPQLAGDELPPSERPADHPAEPELHRRSARSGSSRRPAAAARAAPIAASTRCRAPTATSASSPPSTSTA